MSVITELEPTPRGPFCGAFGVVAGNGDLELALPIRTAWRVGRLVEFAAGCGIVWESDPDSEEMESRLKVARWLELVEGRHRAMA
jgi:anthranilate/para-aminobenzoate synthase component I